MLKVVESFQESNVDNYFIMDQNKNSYVYFTDELETDKNVHSSSDFNISI